MKYLNYFKQHLNENTEILNYEYFNISPESNLEDDNLDIYQVSTDAYNIANENDLNILSDKDLAGVILETTNNIVVGCLFISNCDVFSFDIAIKKDYQKKGLSNILIKEALKEYSYQNDIHKDMYDKPLPMRVDVINPILANILKTKYDFQVVKRLSDSRVIMSKKINR